MELTLEQALQKGVEAHRTGKAQEAARYYTSILKANPKHPDANHNMGVLSVGLNKVETALPFFKTALEVNPNITQFWLSYIDALIKLDRIEDAKVVFDQAKNKEIKGDLLKKIEKKLNRDRPTNKQIKNQEPPKDKLQSLINLYNQGKLQQVLEQTKELVKEYPENLVLLNLMGASATQIGYLDQAVLAFQKATVIKPNHAEAYSNMGVALQKQGKLKEALKAYGKAVSIMPDYAAAYYNMGNALKEQGKLEEALEAYNKTISIKPDNVQAYYNMGNALKEQGKLEEALEAYNKAVSVKPNYAAAFYNMGNTLKEQGKPKEAIEAYKKAISIKPDNVEVYSNMGNALKEQGKLEEAIEAYKKAITIKPNYIEAATNLAILFFEIKRFEEAAKLFSMDDSIKNQSYLLKCFYELDEKSKFYNQLDYLIERGDNNCTIGSYISRSRIRYGINKENPFCNDPFKYVIQTDLSKKCDFKKIFVDNVASVLSNGRVSHKDQGHLKNGIQTSGNIFSQVGSVTNLWQDMIQSELKDYKDNFCYSKEGLIQDWPSDYSLYGWLVSMKSGGELSAHIHDTGWITGSIYINVPAKSKIDSGNLVVTTHDPKDGNGNSKDIKSIDVVTGTLCLFPSSLLHYTIPFESNEDRIVLAFDVIPNK